MRQPRPATPPPDFDAGAAVRSLRRLRELGPDRLLLTHFGQIDDPDAWLEQAGCQLDQWCAAARDSRHRDDPRALELELLAAFAAQEGLADADPQRFAVFGGFTANATGLSHWASPPAPSPPCMISL